MIDLGRWLREEYRVPGEDAVSFEGGRGEDPADDR
jgi:endogenous inhibitor of DNA gyrase (YacG/DUF329 family)